MTYTQHVFHPNKNGSDYVVGDIHGQYDRLLMNLELLKFNRSVDRLFCVGDMIDRGAKSLDVVRLLESGWFFSVRGNHEQMMINAIKTRRAEVINMWIRNGGEWCFGHSLAEINQCVEVLDALPHVITIGQGKSRINIVHAELLVTDLSETQAPFSDDRLDQAIVSDRDVTMMLFGRHVISKLTPFDLHHHHDPDNLSTTFCGHTVLTKPTKYGKQIFLDGGACYGNPFWFADVHKQAVIIPTTGEMIMFDELNNDPDVLADRTPT